MTMKILCDTREKLPYSFDGYACEVEKATLPIGDYSILGCDDVIAVERKQLDDLVSCLLSGRERFIRELVRARGLKCFAIVVESSLEAIARGQYRSAMKPHAVLQSLFAMQVEHAAPFVFAGDRAAGQYVTFSLLEKYAKSVVNAADRLVEVHPVFGKGGKVDLHAPRNGDNFAFVP